MHTSRGDRHWNQPFSQFLDLHNLDLDQANRWHITYHSLTSHVQAVQQLMVHIKHTSAHWHIGASFHAELQIEYLILTYKVLDPMPAISAYSAIFPPSSAAIWCSIAKHQAHMYAPMCRCAPMHVLYGPAVDMTSYDPFEKLWQHRYIRDGLVSAFLYVCETLDLLVASSTSCTSAMHDITQHRVMCIIGKEKVMADNNDEVLAYWQLARTVVQCGATVQW